MTCIHDPAFTSDHICFACRRKAQQIQRTIDGLTSADEAQMNQRTEETQRKDDFDSASEGHP